MLKNNKNKPNIKICYYDMETVTLERADGCVFWQLSGIIEINGDIVEKFNFLVNPGEDVEIDDSCLKFNDLTIEQLKGYEHHTLIYDKFISLLDKYCNKFDKTDKMFLIGYNNISFDNPRLRDWFTFMDKKKQNKYPAFGSYFWSNSIDVFPLLSLIFIKYRNIFTNFKLETVGPKCAEMGLIDKEFADPAKFHDAMFDVEITRALFKAALKIFSLDIFDKKE